MVSSEKYPKTQIRILQQNRMVNMMHVKRIDQKPACMYSLASQESHLVILPYHIIELWGNIHHAELQTLAVKIWAFINLSFPFPLRFWLLPDVGGGGGLLKCPSSVHVCVIPSIRDLVSATRPTCTSFIGFTWNFVDFLPIIGRCACGFGILIWLFSTELSPMVTYFIHPWSCLCNSYIFQWIQLKLCRLPFYDMRMCTWFPIFIELFLTELFPMLTYYTL